VSSVEIWQVDLAQDAGVVAALRALLADEERERATRLKRPGAGDRWTVARAALRIVLGSRIGCLPEEIHFELTEHGKPELTRTHLCFNLSHSGERALVALADVEVGVDIERTNRSKAAVERTLSAGERASGDDLLQIWCRKEALAKAIGGGLGWAPEKFDTSLPDEHALVDLEVDPGYVGAVAVAGERADVTLYRLALSGIQTRMPSAPRLPENA
jgi:4'-phosphopantetheinyl transferase